MDEDFAELLIYAAGIEELWQLERFVDRLPAPVRRRMVETFGWQAHRGQAEPPGEWRVWMLMAGRGFGKTRAGAEWVWARVREGAPAGVRARIALVAGSDEEAAKVMVEGPSGLLATARTNERPVWLPSRGLLLFADGAEAHLYSAEAPERLRGPEHDFAWCDELAKWPASPAASGQTRADAAWDNLVMGVRRGERPRIVVTTTPRPRPIVRRVIGIEGTLVTGGRTADNPHLPEAFVAAVRGTYGGTRLGRQELEGELIEEVAGSLWPREVIERARVVLPLPWQREGSGVGSASAGGAYPGRYPPPAPPCVQRGGFKRIVVGVDPPASADGDACGVVVCGLGADGGLYVLADCSVEGMRPEGWARAVAAAAGAWGADRVVAEKNQGGDMVESVLRGAGAWLPVRLVSASRGKTARAEPVAALFEAGKAFLAGRFPALEDEMAGMTAAGGYEGPGRSPDRADAMVWAMTELMQPPRAEPRVRRL